MIIAQKNSVTRWRDMLAESLAKPARRFNRKALEKLGVRPSATHICGRRPLLFFGSVNVMFFGIAADATPVDGGGETAQKKAEE
jgi:hypothetical protein